MTFATAPSSRTSHNRLALTLAGIGALVAWIVVIAITVPQAQSVGPQPNGDYGFFTAVAERLVAGDRLYVDIWDNKDPFVFYSIAIARSLGIWGAWALEVLWMIAAAVAVWSLARWSHTPRGLALFAAWAATPLLIVGLPYFMGSTHVPAIALTLVAVAGTVRNRPVLTGLVLAALLFLKLIVLPVAVVAVGVGTFVMRRGTSPMSLRPFLGRVAIAFGAGVVAVIALLALRGELSPYVNAQIANVLYSQTPIVPVEDPSLFRWVLQHIVTLVNPHVFAVLLTTGGLLLWFAVALRSKANSSERTLWWIAAATFVTEVLIVGAVSKWLHHALVFAISSALVVLIVSRGLVRTTRGQGVLGIVALAALTYTLMGLPSPSVYVNAVKSIGSNVAAAKQLDRASSALADVQPAPVAFIGAGNVVPRSFELTDWPLACRHIAQRHFDSPRNFTETLNCLTDAEVIVIAPDAEPRDGFDEYNNFLQAARRFASEGRSCRERNGVLVCSTSAS